ncbi:MAG TPA: hypothetical protein VG796_16825 [Verrucomicrobiales bacterium]|nr:hypothetical protein [Verrucomicrobiales bacterium]
MIRSLTTLLCLSALYTACGEKPAAPGTPAAPAATDKKAPAVRIISDWGDWKKQDSGASAKIEIKKDLPEKDPPKDDKRPKLPPEAEKAGVLVLSGGDLMSLVKYEGKEDILPREGYEIAWDAMRVEGNDFFSALTFPVGKPGKDGKDKCVTFVNGGWGGWVVGISSIGHQFASENESTRSYEFKNGRWYRFTLQVTPEVIRCLIDGKEQFKVDIRDKALTMHPSEIQRCIPLGFSTYQTTGAIRNLQIRKLAKDELKPDEVPQ